MLDTDQLRSFVAIVDTGSFTRAAERVNKTQSAVSMHIRRLEEQLGRALFLKQGRGVKLSDDGEKLVEYARRMLELEAQALADISRKALAGRIRFGIPDDYAETFIPEIMSRFGRRHPLVEMTVVCEDSLTLCDRVAAREVDMAVVTVCSDVRGAEILRQEPLYWVTGAASRAHEARPLPLALSGPSCAWRAEATDSLQSAGIPWRQMLVSANHAAIGPVVSAGLAVTVLPASGLRTSMRILDQRDGLPALSMNAIGLIEGHDRRSAEAVALAEEIRATLKSSAVVAPALRVPDPPPPFEGVTPLRARARSAG
jgi:DNA-binding transcriptional LysR family regulator